MEQQDAALEHSLYANKENEDKNEWRSYQIKITEKLESM
jgi:hypothetical protein